MQDRIEEARRLLQREVATGSLRAVAERVGIDHTTLRTFVTPGGVQKPKAKVLEPILAYAATRLGSEAEPRPADGEPLAGITRDDALVWRGRLMEIVNVQRSANESMQALLRMFERATEGVHEFVQSNVLPMPQDPTTQNGPEREAQLRAELDELVRRNREPTARAAGGGGG